MLKLGFRVIMLALCVDRGCILMLNLGVVRVLVLYIFMGGGGMFISRRLELDKVRLILIFLSI